MVVPTTQLHVLIQLEVTHASVMKVSLAMANTALVSFGLLRFQECTKNVEVNEQYLITE